MPRQYVMHRDVAIPMRDGLELMADVWLPDTTSAHPTLLLRTPYDRTDAVGTEHYTQLRRVAALDAGFAVVVQDVRGRHGSPGVFEPFVHEADDGIDTIRWIREQDFCTGWVGTYGASYVGATQLLPATSGQPAQDAMALFVTSGDLCEPWSYLGGALQLGFLIWWVTESLLLPDLDHRGLAADDPAREFAARVRADPSLVLNRLPVIQDDLLTAAPYLRDWLAGGRGNPFWDDLQVDRQAPRVSAPALHMAGFNDLFLEGSIATYQALRAESESRDSQYLVLGPWSHGNLGEWQGRRWLGPAADASAIDLNRAQLEFLRAAVDRRSPERPRVLYFTSGTNVWREASEWPPPGSDHKLYLAEGLTLSWDEPLTSGECSYVSDPMDPVPTTGGATFLPGLQSNENSGPQSQGQVEARSDVLVFRSAELPAPVQVSGKVTLHLQASSDAEDCDWTARLVDVDDNGESVGIVDGILRSRYRHGPTPTPLQPGQSECFTVEVGSVSHTFHAGHRIGLQIASSNFPRFDRNPQTMADPLRTGPEGFRRAQQTVMFGSGRPSHLILPTC